MERIIKNNMIKEFEKNLMYEEKSENTIMKYLRDIQMFCLYLDKRPVDKMIVREYKESLVQKYAITSVNSMIAAINAFFRYVGWDDCCVKQHKIQRQAYCSKEKELTKEEYIRLVNVAKSNGNERLNLIIQTICGTGIRVSELQFITIEAIKKGEATVNCKGKTRTVFIVRDLCKLLLQYAKLHNVKSGAIFITKSGKPINRCNVWRDMKLLCQKANVNPSKVFPHNLRHLFARTFYGIEKDIAKLADILGHSNINTTRIYVISTGIEHQRKIERMRLII